MGAEADPPDFTRFLGTLDSLATSGVSAARGLFAAGRDVVVGRAPGRLDVMGGIADYSGSLVLQLPTREATFAAVQRDPERRLRIVSLPSGPSPRGAAFEMPLGAFEQGGGPIEYAQARELFLPDPATSWAAYVAGVFLVLAREKRASFELGARILIASDVPEGKGVSSSAALEVAVMFAVARAYGITLEAREAALLCQKVENLVVGAPCGVMDQMTASCGEADRLLALLCQPAELREPLALPSDVAVYGIDSGIRHAVTGADYGSVRAAAFMGSSILAEAGAQPRGGYVANLTPAQLEDGLLSRLPERMRGAEFLARHGATRDPVTRVEPEREYSVRVATAHPIYEHARVRSFVEALAAPASEQRREILGELMRGSHASYSACGLGSSGTDRLVDLVAAERAERRTPLYGAKITGGGCGGTVAVLASSGDEARQAVERVADRYAAETGARPKIFSGSSPGAARFGTRIVQAMLLAGLAATTRAADKQVSKFDFGPGKAASGYTQVLADTTYSDERGFGFDLGSKVECFDRGGKDAMKDSSCTSDKPFFFSVKVPEGNYRITLTLGDAAGASVNTVKAESRRLMLTKVETHAGDFDTRQFTVNVRNSKIPGGGEVRLNDRELGVLHWDDKLTLEFSNLRPSVATLEIERVEDAITVFIAGDSTVTDQTQEPYAAWGQMLPRFFKPTVAIANHAESGESLKAFVGQRRLDKLLSQMKAGDYLFIQFTHNDQKPGPNYVEAGTTYKDEVKRFIAEARKRRATPVLVTSMHRRKFDTTGKIQNTLGEYPEALRQVAKEEGTPLIDLAEISKVFYETLGPESSTKAFVHYPAGSFPGQTEELKDDTHFNTYGAYELARAVVNAIKKVEPRLARHLLDRIPPWDPAHPDRVETWSMPPDPRLPNAPPLGR